MVLLAIDVDSTLHDYWSQFRAAAQQLHGVDLPYDQQTDWAVPQLSGRQLGEVIEHTHRDEQILSGVLYPGASQVIRAWRDAGHRILITTHRRPESHEITARWLEQVGVPFDELRCGYLKVQHCTEVGADLLIDDSPTNLRQALEVGVAGATIRHPWNAELCASEPRVTHADTWDELAAALAASHAELRTAAAARPGDA